MEIVILQLHELVGVGTSVLDDEILGDPGGVRTPLKKMMKKCFLNIRTAWNSSWNSTQFEKNVCLIGNNVCLLAGTVVDGATAAPRIKLRGSIIVELGKAEVNKEP